MILINGGSSMANLSKSLDQHWTQDITVPSNALCLQFSYFKEWMYYLPVCENNFLFILCTITYLYLILVILEGKKRRLQIGKGSSYFINTSKQKRGIFGKLKGK